MGHCLWLATDSSVCFWLCAICIGIQIAATTADKRVFEGIYCGQVRRMGSCLGRGIGGHPGQNF